MAFLSTISTFLSKRKNEPSILGDREIKRLRQEDSISDSSTKVDITDDNNMILDKIIESTQLELSPITSSSTNYQNSMNKLIMSYVQSSSSIDVLDSIPRANLIRNIYSTKLIENINQDKSCNKEERLLWNIVNILFEENDSTTVSDDDDDDHHPTEKRNNDIIKPSSQHISELKKWIQNTVLEETKLIYQQEFGFMIEIDDNDDNKKMDIIEIIIKKKNDNDDPWKIALYYMSTGQIFKACELLLQLGDNALSTLISLHHQGYDIRESVMEQLKLWKDQGILETLPIYQQKMWFILQGDLGYVNQLKSVVVQDLYWPQVLFLYMNYFDRYGNIFSGLTQYHYITHNNNSDKVVGIHQLKTRNHTATPSLINHWYYLLIWWLSSPSSYSFTYFKTFLHHDTIHRKQLELNLPLRFRWLLSLHAPTVFNNEINEMELWKDQWCDLLYQDKWEYLAIYASLFISNSHNTIYRLLSLREWEKEFYLTEQLKIPKQWIMDAKVTYAFNHRMYTKEIHYYLETGEIEKAYNAIINHLIPVSFFKVDQSDTTKLYLSKLSELYPNDNNIQQIINNLLDIQRILFTFPGILKTTNVNYDQLEEMKNELKLVFQHLKHLKEVFVSSIKPDFCSKIAGKLLIVVSLFRDHELFNHLLETCPIEYHCDNDMIKIISKSMVHSFNT